MRRKRSKRRRVIPPCARRSGNGRSTIRRAWRPRSGIGAGTASSADLSLEGYDRQIERVSTVHRATERHRWGRAVRRNLQVDRAYLAAQLATTPIDRVAVRSGPLHHLHQSWRLVHRFRIAAEQFTACSLWRIIESYVTRLEAYPELNASGHRPFARGGATRVDAGLRTDGRFRRPRSKARLRMITRSSPFWQPFAQRPAAISDADWQTLQSRAQAALTKGVFPAYREVRAILSHRICAHMPYRRAGYRGDPGRRRLLSLIASACSPRPR